MSRGIGPLAPIALLVAAFLGVAAPPAVVAAPTPAVAPTAQPPTAGLLSPGTLTAVAIPLRISWPAATPADAPIYRYELQRSADGERWIDVPLPSRLARSKLLKLRPWQVHTFRVRATDTNALPSEWAASAPVWLSATQEDDESVDLSSGWQSGADTEALGSRKASTSTAGESASFTFRGREVGWVAQRGPGRGVADVYVDGSWATSVDLYRATNAKRRVVFRAQWPTVAQHTLEVVQRGTLGRPIVDIDAFVTLTDPTTETLVGAGDIASCADGDDEATAAVVATVEGIVFTTGDNVYPDGTAANYANCYESSWGAFKNRTRPVPGNHDYYNNPGGAPYFAYFGRQAGDPSLGYYAYEVGTWRVYALNSECNQVGGCGVGSAQYNWLAADLVASPHRCVAAMWHRPRFSSGAGHGSSTRTADIFALLYDHGAELVLAGHEHNYERFAPMGPTGLADPQGVREFVVGTGGASRYGFASPLPASEVRDNTSYGVLRLGLAPGGYSWRFLPAGTGTFTDSGSDTCH